MGVETVEAVRPFGVGAAEPVVHREQALELKPRGAALTIACPADEAGPLQDLQMLGDGRLGQRRGLCKLHNPRLTRGQPLEDSPTGGIGKGGEGAAEGVSGDYR